MGLSSSVEVACGPGGWRSEKKGEARQRPTGWAPVLLPSSLPPGLVTGQDLSPHWAFLPAITLAQKSGQYWCSAEPFGEREPVRTPVSTRSSQVRSWSFKAKSELEIDIWVPGAQVITPEDDTRSAVSKMDTCVHAEIN